ncbi:addiction module toxin RelE [Spirochaetia bacterium]|nr:addiction module toxin RelE [Spirochaetia bacterium]
MRVFKNTWFNRFARKEGIADDELKTIVNEVLEEDLADADYGGGVYKVRLARPGEGKSGGYRVLVFFRSGDKTFFQFGFAKSKMTNIPQKKLNKYKLIAKVYLALTDEQLQAAVQDGEFIEI